MGIAPDPPTFIDGTGYLEVVMAGSEFLQRLPFNLATPFKAGLAPTQDPYRAVKLSSGGRPQMLVTGVNGTDVWVTAAVNDSVLQVQENVPQAGQEEVTLHESDTGVGGLAFTDCRYRTMLAVAPDDSSKEVCLAGFGGIAQQDSSNLWVTEFTNSRAANVTTSGGVITDVGDDLPSGDAGAIDVASTPGGDMWFTEFKAGNIASRPKGKQFSEIAIPGCDNCGPYGITAGPAQLGGIWFTEQRSNEVVEMNTATNTFHSWMLPTANSQPTGITAAPDGSLYVTEYAAGKVAKLTVDPTTWAGAWTEYTLPYDARSYPYWITAGPAVPGLPESLWVTLPYRDQVAEICFPGCP
jgi:streptogramin lyase